MRSRAVGTSSSHLSGTVQSVIHRIGGLRALNSSNKRGYDTAPSSSPSSQTIFGSNIFINEKSFVTNRFDVAQGALRSLLGTPFESLFPEEAREQRDAEDSFRHLKALRRSFSDRTEIAMRITVPRDFINEFEGFVPFFLEQCRFHKSQMEAARIALSTSATGDGGAATSGPLDDDNVNVERLLDWFELFYPEKDYSVLPFPQLLAALDGFFAYQKGGIDTGVPLGHFRPYFGVEIPATSEEYKLYRVLYHWLEEFGVKSGTFRTALDAGTRSGYLSALMVKANMNTVVAVDDNDFALQCLQDNLKRLYRRKAIKRRAVFTQKSGDLLPKGSPSSRGHSTKGVGEGLLANPFLEAAKRRRLVGRSPLMNVAGSADEPLETHGLFEDGIADISSLGRAFDLITFHRPVPNLFDHPLYSAASRNSAHSAVDSQLDKVLTLLESSPDHNGLLNPDKGHIAIISSNYHELLHYSSQTSSLSSSSTKARLEETLAHTIHSRSERQHAKTRVSSSAAASSTKRIVGWDIVKRETRPLAALGEQYFGGGGIGGIFKSIISDKSEGYAAYTESKRFYDKLQHEMVVIKPRYTTLFGGLGYTAGKKGAAVTSSSHHKPARDAVDPFATNDLIDWEDTYEYNHYLPKDGTGNPFHLTAAIDSYSYLSDDYYGEGSASALEIGSGSAKFYNSSDPADVLGRVPRPNMASVDEARARKSASEARRAMRYNKDGEASAADVFVRSSTSAANKSEDIEDGTSLAKRADINRKTGTTPMFDLLFNREMRLGRRKKWRKLGFDANERQRYYLDKKVVESQAAKLQVLNEIDRFDFRDPSKY